MRHLLRKLLRLYWQYRLSCAEDAKTDAWWKERAATFRGWHGRVFLAELAYARAEDAADTARRALAELCEEAA